jgi:hypothetical protein
MRQENAVHIKDFLKAQFTFGDQTYYRDGTDPLFRFYKETNPKDQTISYIFIDEKEKIELLVGDETMKQLTNKLKSNNAIVKGDSILTILFDEYQQENYRTIAGKPYVVYDVETLYATMNLKGLAFELGYTITSSDYHTSFERLFKYVEKDAIKKYVDFLLDFDGYIIGFNNIWFDNIVIAYNAWYGQDVIDKLNEKTIDIFYYLRNLTNKRMGLNKVATALVGLQKTLVWGWAEWVELLKDWLATGNTDSLKKVKEYCKWDVKMTLGVLLYLYRFWEFFIDWEQYNFNEEDFITLGKEIKKQEVKNKKEGNTDWLF